MTSYRLIVVFIILISFCGICLTSCGKPPAKVPTVQEVVGKWVAVSKEFEYGGRKRLEKNPGIAIEIFKDKTIDLPYGKGTWTILPDGRLKIEIAKLTLYGSLQNKLMTIAVPTQHVTVVLKKQ